MDYERIYMSLMSTRQSLNRQKGLGAYYEEHHIKPTCLGGSNDKHNRVLLTAREHFIAHLLLVHTTTGQDRARMAYALHMMCQNNPNQQRVVNSRQFETARTLVSVHSRGANHPSFGSKRTVEQRKAISLRMSGPSNPRFGKVPWNKGLTAKTSPSLRKSGETYRRTVSEHPEILEGRKHSEETKRKIGMTHRGRPKSVAHRRKLSEALKGRGPSPEAIEKSAAARRGRSQETVECPHCGKVGGRPSMARWHFDNCKEKLA